MDAVFQLHSKNSPRFELAGETKSKLNRMALPLTDLIGASSVEQLFEERLPAVTQRQLDPASTWALSVLERSTDCRYCLLEASQLGTDLPPGKTVHWR